MDRTPDATPLSQSDHNRIHTTPVKHIITMTPKRSLSPAEDVQPNPKRSRMDFDVSEMEDLLDDDSRAIESLAPTQQFQARSGIQRSIAMVLKHDGFESASPEALESFTGMVETCELISGILLTG